MKMAYVVGAHVQLKTLLFSIIYLTFFFTFINPVYMTKAFHSLKYYNISYSKCVHVYIKSRKKLVLPEFQNSCSASFLISSTNNVSAIHRTSIHVCLSIYSHHNSCYRFHVFGVRVESRRERACGR